MNAKQHELPPSGSKGLESRSPVLELSSLSKSYGKLRAVADVSLTVREGEFLTLLGASGSGKSTILMMIAGFVDPTSGDIRVRGKSIVGVSPHKRRIGVVFQNYALFPHLSVFENIAFSLRNARMDPGSIRARVDTLLDTVKLFDMEHRLPGQLSGGQQQRVAIARALALNPDILLFDEPLGALDKSLREHLVFELQGLHARLGTTMIYVTHDQQEALVMSDRIAVMEHGRIVALDAPQALYDEPGSAFVAGFLGHANILSMPGAGTFALRPERVVLGTVPEGWTARQGQLMSAAFLGDRFRYEVRLEDGQMLYVSVPHSGGVTQHAVGTTVALGWSPDDARPVTTGEHTGSAAVA